MKIKLIIILIKWIMLIFVNEYKYNNSLGIGEFKNILEIVKNMYEI